LDKEEYMTNLKRQRLSLIFLSLIILLMAAAILYVGMKFYDDKQMYIVVRTYDDGEKYYSINKYSIKQEGNFAIKIYDRSSNEEIIYNGWEYRDFELIEKQNMSGK
jgi:hypothetical protein